MSAMEAAPIDIGLDDLAAAPHRASELSAAARRGVILKCAAIQAAIASIPEEARDNAPDELIDVKDAAAMIGMSEFYIYDHADELPFVHREGRRLKCSRAGVERYLKRKR